MPDKTKKVVMNPTDDQKAHAARVLELSRQWGVPTESIYSQAHYGAKDIFSNKAPRLSTQYFTFDPAGRISHSITDRYEDTRRGYSASMIYDQKYLGKAGTATDSIPRNPLLSKASMEYGGRFQMDYTPYGTFSPGHYDNPVPMQQTPTNNLQAPTFMQPGATPASGKTSISLGPAIVGMNSLINQTYRMARQGDEQARKIRQQAMTEVYHPYQYGDGSEVLYRNGGSLPGKSIQQISSNPFSSPVVEFNGPSHEEGGIPIQYGSRQVEVEGEETGYLSRTGDMHIFGNLLVPGTRMKFKTAGKKLAAEEVKASQRMARAGKILKDVEDPDDLFQAARLNSGMVQGQAATRQLATLTLAKENLADLQESMLLYAKERGIEPRKLFGTARYGKKIAPDGITLPARKTIDPWALPDTPEAVLQGSKMMHSAAGQPLKIVSTPQQSEATAPVPRKEGLYTRTPTYDEPLSFGQIAPELYALGTNRVEPVPFQQYTPSLYAPYQVSFRDQLQENNATFKALAGNLRGNAPALSVLAANKYQADTAILGAEHRANEGIRNQVSNQNTALLNQAQLQNLEFAERADTARQQNAAASRATTQAALQSISAKALQQKATNANRTLMNQMIPNYRYDPTTMQWVFAGGQAPITVNGLPVYDPASLSSLYGDQEYITYQRDSKGRLVSRNKARSPGLLRLFR